MIVYTQIFFMNIKTLQQKPNQRSIIRKSRSVFLRGLPAALTSKRPAMFCGGRGCTS